MNWIELITEEQLAAINQASVEHPVVIFKHSTRCSISAMVKSRFERGEAPADVSFYYLDLIRYRPISNKIAHDYAVEHESPQLLLIKNGSCVYNESHNGISMEELTEQVK
jgi:bacillithiol system protein YtxJ